MCINYKNHKNKNYKSLIVVLFTSLFLFKAYAETITVYSYDGESFDPQVIKEFSKETGINVKTNTINNSHNIISYLRKEEALDIAILPHHLLADLIEDNLISPLNYKLLSNSSNLQHNINKKLNSINNAVNYAITMMYSVTRIAVNKELAEKALNADLYNSWDLIFKEQVVSKLASCGVGIMDEPVNVMAALLNYQAQSLSVATSTQLDKAGELLTTIKPYIKIVGGDYREQFKQGKLCVAVTRTPNLGEQITPLEGTFITLETAVINATSKHIEAAHKFIDFMLRPNIAARNLAYVGFPIPNTKIKDLVKPELANNVNLFPSNKDLALMQTLPKISPSITLQQVRLEFDNIKRSSN